MVTKCPVCRSSKITTNEKGEIGCKNCNYLWKPSKIHTTKKEGKIMGLTTSQSGAPAGQELKAIQITEEQKKEMKARDMAQLSNMRVDIEEITLQIEHAKKALELNLPIKKMEAEIRKLEFELAAVSKNVKILEERNK